MDKNEITERKFSEHEINEAIIRWNKSNQLTRHDTEVLHYALWYKMFELIKDGYPDEMFDESGIARLKLLALEQLNIKIKGLYNLCFPCRKSLGLCFACPVPKLNCGNENGLYQQFIHNVDVYGYYVKHDNLDDAQLKEVHFKKSVQTCLDIANVEFKWSEE